MVNFKQVILPGDKGRDVVAVKRGLHFMGFKTFSVITRFNNHANNNFEAAIRAVQHHHNLNTDGIYGERTHAVIAKHFDKYADYLYTHAKKRHRSGYVNPFMHSKGLQVGRIDEGVDYHGYGAIVAWADMEIVGLGGSGWPGGHYINARVTAGRHAGRFYYCAEAIVPVVRVGQRLKASDHLCDFGWGAAPGLFPGIETGWGSSIVNLTWAVVTHRAGSPPFSNTEPGKAFCRLMHAVKAPAPPVDAGPEFV
jgi:hypothetical protein